MANSVGPLALMGLTFVGFAILWARQIIYRNVPVGHQDIVRLILSLAGSLLILIGLLGTTAHVTYFLAPFACLAAISVAMMLVMRYRTLERHSLLKCIAVAAEKGIPLSQAVRSFAKERTDEIGYRALILAESLDIGMALPTALQHSKTGLPVEALVAMRLGYETGSLGPSVSRVANPDDSLDIVARALFEKYLYLGTMLILMTTCVSFFVIKIMPVFQRMLLEFGVEIPELTQMSINYSEMLAAYWYLLIPLLLPLVLLMVITSLNYVGLLPRDFPGLAWLTRRSDGAVVLRCLSVAVAMKWPLNKTLWMLARIFPRRSMRQRLARAGGLMDNGENWCDSLWRARIIGRPEWAVLKAAQKSGNVEWALDAMADSSTRRMIYRLRLFLNIAFPTVLLGFGCMVAFFVIAFFIPLVQLIQGLA